MRARLPFVRHATGSLRVLTLVAASLATLAWPADAASAASCKAEDITSAVDATGAQLRTYTMQTQPVLQPKLRALAAKNGWGEEGYEEAAFGHLKDTKVEQLDRTAQELLTRIDQLGEIKPGEAADCERVQGIKAAGVELLAVMKAKTAHLNSKIDAELGTAVSAGAAAPVVINQAPASQSGAPSQPKPADVQLSPANPSVPAATPPASPPKAVAERSPPPADPSPPVRKPAERPIEGWQTKTTQPPAVPSAPPAARGAAETTVAILPPTSGAPPAAAPLPGGLPRPSESLRPPAPIPEGELEGDEYTIDEIREASRGFFGNLSTGLASVIEHAFRRSGRPKGYILGNEGGGAFIGGLRYGNGTLYLRRGGTERVYWHGPSLGFDFGASGTRTIFLVYKIREPLDIYRTFTGIDGSAFAVGGVGITLLSGGNMILAPIRSGLGLRLGASIGYIRFTAKRTWNPL